jgi:hypothetical protein
MDKGYDSEAIHRLIWEDLHANSVIPIRSWKNEIIGVNTVRKWLNSSMTLFIQDDNLWKINSLS